MAADRYAGAGVLLKALSHPLRIALVTELSAAVLCVHDLVDAVGVSQSLVSQHLRILRAAAVVRGSRRGKEIYYSITDEHVAHIVADAVRHTDESHRFGVASSSRSGAEHGTKGTHPATTRRNR
jgi:DNA-binding transcriptional ArsR family regulator